MSGGVHSQPYHSFGAFKNAGARREQKIFNDDRKQQLDAQIARQQAEVAENNAKRSMYKTRLNRIADERWRLSGDPMGYRDKLRKLDDEESQVQSQDRLAYFWGDTLYQNLISNHIDSGQFL